MRKFYKIAGIGLLELMLALAIIAILLVTATRYFEIASFSEKLNDTTNMVQTIRAAGVHWLIGHDDFTTISIDNLKARNLLPTNFGTNPWNGLITVGPAEGNSKIEITVADIPMRACNNLVDRFQSTAPLAGECIDQGDEIADYVGIF